MLSRPIPVLNERSFSLPCVFLSTDVDPDALGKLCSRVADDTPLPGTLRESAATATRSARIVPRNPAQARDGTNVR